MDVTALVVQVALQIDPTRTKTIIIRSQSHEFLFLSPPFFGTGAKDFYGAFGNSLKIIDNYATI